MKLSEVEALLSSQPLCLETGFERLSDGVLHVACRTDMHDCSGEMLEWWFRSRPDTERYVWWHPVDHVSSAWSGGFAHTHVGATHRAEEAFTVLPVHQVSIQMREPTEFFRADAYADARSVGEVSAMICARIAESHVPPMDGHGRILGGRLLHVGRDTEWGMVLRSHFYIGHDLPATGLDEPAMRALFPDAFARALLQHCYNEFTFLSRFLRSLYQADNRASLPISLPW